jgi:hypothetical protein
MVSPPTWGWSRMGDRLPFIGVGSPAPAGMVPSSCLASRPITRFPRPCGDGPVIVRSVYLGFMVPPPRGDGPIGAGSIYYLAEVPPPLRGWSRRPCQRPIRPIGSPASAGMVPGLSLSKPARARFPRPRGDGPADGLFVARHQAVPPPPRGWSLDVTVDGAPLNVPRPRGDGPSNRPPGAIVIAVPPPSRGWSRQTVDGDHAVTDSPASAGMIPSSPGGAAQ